MMTLEDRERAFEAKYAFDQLVQFKQLARRDKLFAQGAAAELHLDDQGSAGLMADVLHIHNGPGHDERVLALIEDRFASQRRTQRHTVVAAALKRCALEAELMITEPVPAPMGH